MMTVKLDAAVSSSFIVQDGVAASEAAILEKCPVKRLVSIPRGTDDWPVSKMLLRGPNHCVQKRPFPEQNARRMSWSFSRGPTHKLDVNSTSLFFTASGL